MRQCGPKNYFGVGGQKGGSYAKWFSSNYNQFKAFQDQFYVLGYRTVVNESIPTIETKIQIFIVRKMVFFDRF